MKPTEHIISIAVAGLCIILAITVVILGSSNQRLQGELQKQQLKIQEQQAQINEGNAISQQVGPGLLRDMAMVSVEEPAMKELLAKHGYTVNVTDPPAGSTPPASTPTPIEP